MVAETLETPQITNDPNFASGSIWASDNLAVLRGMNAGCVDLIYLDPPFNSNRIYEAPIGSKAAGASFKDAWTLSDIDIHEHGELADRCEPAYKVIEAARSSRGKGMMSYLIFMAVRLLEMERVLKPTGSIYLHCDPTANHYLKMLMDAIFSHYRNDIIWCYRGRNAAKRAYPRQHDTLLFYGKSAEYTFNIQRIPYKALSIGDLTGTRSMTRAERDRLQEEYYARGKPVASWWDDITPVGRNMRERTGYPTQKPFALLERIISASSNKGDLVLDPFCGCATTLAAADWLDRRWAGIDISELAIKLVEQRIREDRGILDKGAITPLFEPPQRTDLGVLPNYRTHKHALYGQQEGICVGCDTHFPFRTFEVDHILPRSRGGTDHVDNLQLLCSHCNRSKGGRTMAEWRAAQ